MDQIHVRESNSEVLVFIDRNMGDRLNAIREAAKILSREVTRLEANINRGTYRQPESN